MNPPSLRALPLPHQCPLIAPPSPVGRERVGVRVRSSIRPGLPGASPHPNSQASPAVPPSPVGRGWAGFRIPHAGSRFLPRTAALLLSLVQFLLFPGTSSAAPADAPAVLLVVGAAGESEFGTNFLQQAELWLQACQTANAPITSIGLSPTNDPATPDDLTQLRQAIEAMPREGGDAWVILVGHGTFDGREARFNLRGPDLTVSNLVEWLAPVHRRLAIINTASASAPFLKPLSGTNRVVITATRSGNEMNFTRFGSRLARAATDPKADLDQDGQTSLLEAFLSASFQVADFYKSEGRLATEHSLLDDNGDGLGTPADWFRGLRATKKPKDGGALDGLRAHQMHLSRSAAENELSAEDRARRDSIELQIGQLRDAKSTLAEDEYYSRIEPLLLELARLYFPSNQTAPKP